MFNSHRAKDNSTLSISSPHISDCREVAEYMRKSGILCHVSPNYTVAHTTITNDSESPSENNNRYAIETGCQIKFGAHSPHFLNLFLWLRLKNRFQLDCAHLEVEGKYKGCVYDYFTKTQCPHSNVKPQVQGNTG